ncbi:MAG: hypothetical protein JWQ78_2073 [Sediminibacterium sp.]|nr:hypothetical protein [Sediminibacterium sp.]
MKQLFFFLVLICFLSNTLPAQQKESDFITVDIDNFWNAYDKITATSDSVLKDAYLNTLFINKGSPGLKAIMTTRSYTAKSYIDAISQYPQFWHSIRPNTLKAKQFAKDIETEVAKLRTLYPELKPSKIYFTIGVLRTGGTTLNGMVLIGSEVALGDKGTLTNELPGTFNHLRPYFDSNSASLVVFNNVHEYVHTQQKTTIAANLLGQALLEGVAEFITVKATGRASTVPALRYGKANAGKIKQRFSQQMFGISNGFWLYENAVNEFNVRDLGYYVGYAISEGYYEKAQDKTAAIKEMIQLDYNDQAALLNFVDRSLYFAEPVQVYKNQFEDSRPTVTGIRQFTNNDVNVDPGLTEMTLQFSTAIDKRYRNFELGPLGKSNLLIIKNIKGFSEDGRSFSFEVALSPGQQYQIVLGEGFRTPEAVPLKPYLVNFKTASR